MKSSARLNCVLQGHEAVRAVGGFSHVFVARQGMRPVPEGMTPKMRAGLTAILADASADGVAKI